MIAVESTRVNLDTTRWSGDGDFTQSLIDCLSGVDRIGSLRVENAPSTRTEVEYNFIANEIYVRFNTRSRVEEGRRFGLIPVTRTVEEPAMSLGDLEASLSGLTSIGPPDYSDEDMLQYLRTERIVPPYQTRGYKLVELVRIYRVEGAEAARPRQARG